MAQVTEHYSWAFFDFGDELDSALNVDREIERFVGIDKQLYGYYKVFGNGVIDGWVVSDGTGLRINITPGVGIINSVASETSFAETIVDLPPNTTVNIYAFVNNSTLINRDISFDFTTGTFGENALLLATVVTGGIAIESIDNDVRSKIGFKALIDEQIAAHRHTGEDSPKIDLTTEVQGLLPSARMDDIDAAKIVGGRLSEKVVGTLDHNSLRNIGTLTHSQLDSFAKSIQSDNVGLLGEVSLINQLKAIIYHKYLNPDYDATFVNELALIPGISPNEHIDFENSNANIDLDAGCISGLPAIPLLEGAAGELSDLIDDGNLQIVTIVYDDDSDFLAAPVKTNVAIDDGVRLSTDTVFDRIIESFDDGVSGSEIPGWTTSLTDNNTTTVTYEQSAAQGALAAKFQTVNSRSLSTLKTFSRAQDWTTYDTLVVFVKNFGATHSTVTMEILDDTGAVLGSYVLLSADEITVFDNPDTAGYAKKEFNIAGFVRSKVGGIRFYTDDITNETEAFFLDTIYLKSSEFLLPQGNLRLRYQSSAPVIFNAVEYYGDVPLGTDIRVRVRVANTLAELSNATYSSLLMSGEVFGQSGQVIEIDITLLSNAARSFTPDLSSVFLTMLVPSEVSGLSIGSAEDWDKGEKRNIAVSTDGVISLDKKNVNNFYFINQGYVNELDPDLVPVAGIRGDLMPIAPYQGFNAITPQEVDEYNPDRSFLTGLYQPTSAYRLNSGNYVIADTGNDRVMEITADGVFVRGYASHNTTYSDSLFAMTANYSPRLGILFITFSRDFDITTADLTNITIVVGTNQFITLSNESDKVRTLKGEILTNRTGSLTAIAEKTLSIVLSTDKQKILNDTNATVGVRVLNDVNLQAIDCFVGDYMYFAQYGIQSPIYVNETSDTRWIVANARLTTANSDLGPNTASVLEFDKEVGKLFEGQLLGTTFVYDGIIFSDIVLGSLKVYEENFGGVTQRKILMGGLTRPGGNTTAGTSSSSSSSGLGSTDKIKLQNFVGTVLLMDMDSQLISFRYNSPDGLYPSDVLIDEDGYYVVAESSMVNQSGRIVTLDANGNVIKLIEGGVFTKINDIRLLNDSHLFIST